MFTANGAHDPEVACDSQNILRHVGAAVWPVAQIFCEDRFPAVCARDSRPDRHPGHDHFVFMLQANPFVAAARRRQTSHLAAELRLRWDGPRRVSFAESSWPT